MARNIGQLSGEINNIYIILIKFEWGLTTGYGRYLIFSKFQELIPRDEEVLSMWKENRRKCYEGSLKHFLRAVSAGRAEEDQFYIYTLNLKQAREAQPRDNVWFNMLQTHDHRVSPKELIESSEEKSSFRTVSFRHDLKIEYWGRTPHELSFLTLKGPSLMIDTLGNLFNPLRLEVGGCWSDNRVAELLPMY